MTDYTPILRLVQPAFDQEPWDSDINNDLAILDAAVGKFFGVANMAGVWANSTAYSAGQVTVDQSDGSMWTCVIAHTSAVAPTTFAADRAANPSFWITAASTAQEYASQASTFATSAATSATAAASSATAAAGSAAIVAGALPLSGGTLTGPLTLAADPTVALGAATKQYVDARVGGVGFLPTTGGTLTGFLTLNADPTAVAHAATKRYVDTKLPLAGGTLTGALVGTTCAMGSAGGYTLSGITGSSWAGNASVVNFAFQTGWRLQFDRSTGNLTYISASNVSLFTLGFSGTLTASNGYLTPLAYTLSNSSGSFYSDTVSTYLKMDSNNWHLQYQRANGDLYWVDTSNTIHFVFRGSDGFAYAPTNSVGGNGAYVNISDARVKHDIALVHYGMQELMGIEPVRFVRNGKDIEELGFTAQNVMKFVPEAVVAVEDQLLAVQSEALLSVVVNALQELGIRMNRLEAKCQK